MTFENGHSNDLNDPDLQYFITNTQFNREIDNMNIIYKFLNDMKYNINYGDKKSNRYNFIKNLHTAYQELRSQSGSQSGSQLGSGLNGEQYSKQYVILPSDPDELMDQMKLLDFEKLGGNDCFLLIEQIIAMVDKLLEYECITTNQHQNILSNLFYQR